VCQDRTHDGAAGEIGHMIVHCGVGRCACGQRGCLEVYASAAGIARTHQARGGSSLMGAAEISTSAQPLAVQVWGEAIELLALALMSTTVVLDPGVIVVAGGLSLAGAALVEPLQAELDRLLTWRPAPPVMVSRLLATSGLYGAALGAWAAAGVPVASDAWP
jgi:glucokinase